MCECASSLLSKCKSISFTTYRIFTESKESSLGFYVLFNMRTTGMRRNLHGEEGSHTASSAIESTLKKATHCVPRDHVAPRILTCACTQQLLTPKAQSNSST